MVRRKKLSSNKLGLQPKTIQTFKVLIPKNYQNLGKAIAQPIQQTAKAAGVKIQAPDLTPYTTPNPSSSVLDKALGIPTVSAQAMPYSQFRETKQPVKSYSDFSKELSVQTKQDQEPWLKRAALTTSKIAATPFNVAIGAAKSIPKFAQGATDAIGQATGYLADKTLGAFGVEPKPLPAGPKVIPDWMTTPSNTAQKVGMFAGETAQYFTPVGLELKLPATASKVARGLSLAGRATGEALKTGMITAGQTGKVGGDALISSGLALTAPIAGGLLSKVKNPLFGSVVGSTRAQKGKDAVRGLNLGEALSKVGFQRSRAAMTDSVGSRVKMLGSIADNLVSQAVKTNGKQSFRVNDITRNIALSLDDELKNGSKLFGDLGITPDQVPKVKKAITETLNGINATYRGKKLNLNDLQTIKKSFGQGLKKEYNSAVGAIQKAPALTRMQFRDNLKQIIEQETPGINVINKELSALLTAQSRLKSKGAYSGYLTDVMAGVAAASNSDKGIAEDPLGYAYNAAKGIALKRGLTSTAAKTLAGAAANNISKLLNNPVIIQALRKGVSGS